MSDVSAFLTARNCLLAHRSDYSSAISEFSWPRMDRVPIPPSETHWAATSYRMPFSERSITAVCACSRTIDVGSSSSSERFARLSAQLAAFSSRG